MRIILYGKTFSHTDLMKQPCLAVKACQQHKYLIVLYTEKLLKHSINRMKGLIKKLFMFLSEKKTNTTIKEVDYPTIIENRRISMQMTTPVSIRHCDNHLKNNKGK